MSPGASNSAPTPPQRPQRPQRPPRKRPASRRPGSLAARLRDPSVWAFVLIGAWVGRASTSATGDLALVVEVVMIGGSALILAIWYRRRVRAALESRRRKQRSGDSAGPDPDESDPAD